MDAKEEIEALEKRLQEIRDSQPFCYVKIDRKPMKLIYKGHLPGRTTAYSKSKYLQTGKKGGSVSLHVPELLIIMEFEK